MTRFSVEPLPSRPNLEHQQKLAKRLLREVWAGDVEAIARVRAFLPGASAPAALKLHDAQAAIARGYGFDSWAAMKRKIESLTHSPLEQFDIAVREGDAQRARELLDAHADVRARIARVLVARGAEVDIFAAARLGDRSLVERCLRDDPLCAAARVNRVPQFAAPGGHIYGWTLGFDLTPADVARKFGHAGIAELIVSTLAPKARVIDALWCGDGARTRRELQLHPAVLQEFGPYEHSLLAAAAWWYRPECVRLMLEVGFDPHVTGAHDSTPLDRASFHGYADIVAALLALDPDPPLLRKNEFGVTPLGTCIHGSIHGWKTGYPQDHVRTLRLLLEAGLPVDPTSLPTGNDELDAVMRAWLKVKWGQGDKQNNGYP
jgi:hypothetical protein